MVDTRTPAQVNADNAAERDRLEAEKRERENQRQASMVDGIKGFLQDFSFGGMIQMALIVTGIYFLMQMPAVQEFVKTNILDRMSPEMQGSILGLMNKVGIEIDMRGALEAMDYTTLHTKLAAQASPEILNIIDPNDGNKTLHEFLDIISTANGGKVTLKGFTSPETIAALIQQKPDMARALLVAAMKPDANGQTSSTAQQMNASIKSLIAGPQLDVLLAPAARAGTLSVLRAALPQDTPISENSLDDMITKGLDANGKPTPALRQLFSDAVDGNKDAVISSAYTLIGPAAFIELIDTRKMTSPAERYAVETVQQNPKAKAACVDFIGAIGNDKAMEFLNSFKDKDAANAAIQLLMKPENVHALPQAVALLEQLPDLAAKLPQDQAAVLTEARAFLTPDHLGAIMNIEINNHVNVLPLKNNFTQNGKFSTDRAVDALLNPTARANLKQAGTENVSALFIDQNAFFTQHNLDALVHFADTIDTGNTASAKNSGNVVKALAKVATGTSMHDAFKGLNGEQLATFFSVPQNRAAFKALLDPKSGIIGETPQREQEIALFRKDYDKGKGVGLAILSNAQAAQFLLDHDNVIGQHLEIVTKGLGMLGNWNKALGKSENMDILTELGKALGNANPSTVTEAETQTQTPVQPKTPADYGRSSASPLG